MDRRITTDGRYHAQGRPWLGPVALCAAMALTLLGPVAASAQEKNAVPQPLSAAAPSAQFGPTGEPSINVTGTGSASAPADTALIQIIVGSNYDYAAMSGMVVAEPMPVNEPTVIPADVPPAEPASPEAGASDAGAGGVPVEPAPAPGGGMGGPPRLTARDLQPIVDALVAAGVARDDIEVTTGPSVTNTFGPGGPGGARLDATIDRPTKEGVAAAVDNVDQAATGAGLMLQYVGVAYNLDDCTTLVRQAKTAAIQDARDQATELASLLGVTLGEMISAYDNSFFGIAAPTATGCPPSPNAGSMFGPDSSLTAPAFDPSLPAEARVISGISLAFAIGKPV